MSTWTSETLKSYKFACQKIGTDEMVSLRRNIFNLSDMIANNGKSQWYISSGSAVEGFDMIGSDLDVMSLISDIVVCTSERDAENVAKANKIRTLIMDTDETYPCYALLRVPKRVPLSRSILCFLEHRGEGIFYSSQLFKLSQLNTMLYSGDRYKIHGPCITTEDDTVDALFCFRCKSWPYQARPWMSRARINHWPSPQLISKIVNFGILLVPIGCKGSINEDIEWRMSFSIAEKLLIYSFNHTQLLCYGLMKLLLKDVIDIRKSLKGLLCSYFLKTILFWLFEESDMWKPEELLLCFRKCICRLSYCVQYSVLIHYFIPQNNFFDNRFTKDDRIQMLGLLQEVYQQGWKCFFVSGTLNSGFHTIYNPNHNSVGIHKTLRTLTNKMIEYFEENETSPLILKTINHFSGVKLAAKLLMFLLSKSYNLKVQRNTTAHYFNNKLQTHQFKQQQSFLIISKGRENPDIGWLYLATFFYRHKRYNVVLEFISHVLSKTINADPVTLDITRIPTDTDETTLRYKMDVLPAMDILTMLVDTLVVFEYGSSLIPDELAIEVTGTFKFSLELIILTHFLKFLSNYHLGDFRPCMQSLRSIEANAQAFYRHNLIGKMQMTSSFLCLGIAHEMMGHLDKAHEYFSTCVSLDEWKSTKAAFRLSKLYT